MSEAFLVGGVRTPFARYGGALGAAVGPPDELAGHCSGRWPTARANARVIRTIKGAPVDLIEGDRAAMLPLSPIPLHLGLAQLARLRRDLNRPGSDGGYGYSPRR
jgi:hypothetical protein